MMTIVQVLQLNADDVSSLMTMADFYSMTIEDLLSKAMTAGLHHAEHVMMENIHHRARIETAILDLEALDDDEEPTRH